MLKLLDLVNETDYFFILETNGILFGTDESYVKALKKYKNLYVRVSFKAGTPEGFQIRTGAAGKFYELPFKTMSYLRKHGIFSRVASMSDPRVMPASERQELIKKLRVIDPAIASDLEEELCDPYPHTIARLKHAGYDVKEFFKGRRFI